MQHVPTLLVILMAIAMQRYYTTRIARWRRFRAFIKATKRHHRASTRSAITQSNTPYQTDEKHFTIFPEYFFGVVKLWFNCYTMSLVTIENLPRPGLHFGAGCQQEILCRATVLIYLQGITAKDFYYSYVKKHRSCWELVGSCSEVKFRSGEIINCDRTCSNNRFLLRVFTSNLPKIFIKSDIEKLIKCYVYEFFGPPRLAPYQLGAVPVAKMSISKLSYCTI